MRTDPIVRRFVQRLREDRFFWNRFRRAPAQVLDGVRGLDPHSRSFLIDIARAGAGALPRLSARIVPPDFFQAYPLTYSVRRGKELQVCIGNQTGEDVDWEIVQVTGFSQETFQDPDGITPNWISNGSTKAAKVTDIRWNAEEEGYGWSPNFFQTVSFQAPLGLYALKLRSKTGQRRAVYFVVRKGLAEFPSSIVLHWPWSTMCAYSGSWDDFKNLYDSYQAKRLGRVSRDRPFFDDGIFNPSSSDKFRLTHEAPLRIWQFVSNMGKEIDSCTSFDLNDEDNPLQGCQLFISAGHDEYWSANMRDRVEELVAAGGNAAFFSANVAWWRVRFEGHVMACYKSGIDDPIAVESPTEATHNWASTDRPENTLTGVGFKRGTMGTVDQVEIRNNVSDPLGLLDGVKATSFPANPVHVVENGVVTVNGVQGTCFSTVETDGADYDESTLQATGIDGSPKNFKVLATSEIAGKSTLDSPLGPHGRATVGYFSRAKGGTVFTGASTDWALLLGDPTVATITANVIKKLSVQLLPGVEWELESRRFPQTSPQHPWEIIRSLPHATAILGVMQGHLLVYDTSTDPNSLIALGTNATNFWATSAENPYLPFWKTELAPIPASPFQTLGGYASDLYGVKIYATDADGNASPVWEMAKPVATKVNAGGWQQRVDGFADGNCLAIAATWGDIAFTITRPLDSGTPFLFAGIRLDPEGNATAPRKLGRTTPPILTMTALDGKLFGVGDDNMIYCRETCTDHAIAAVDLVWSAICPAPFPGGMTHSLTGYLGRLYALAGPMEAPPLPTALLPALAPLRTHPLKPPKPSNTAFAPAASKPPPPTKPFITRSLYWRTATSDFGSITPHMLFLNYTPPGWLTVGDLNGGKGKNVGTPGTIGFAIGQLHGDGYFRTTGGSTIVSSAMNGVPPITFTDVVRVARDRVLFYDSTKGAGWVYQFAADGTATFVNYSDQYEYWRHLVYVHQANSSGPERVFFYDGEKVGTIGHFTDTGDFVAEDWRSDFNQWDHVTATWSGRLVFYDSQFSWVAWGHLDKNGKYVDDGEMELPNGQGYEQAVPAGNEYVVFYKSTGEFRLVRVDALGFTPLAQKLDPLVSNCDLHVSSIGLVLVYDRSSGAAKVLGVFDSGFEYITDQTPADLLYEADSFTKGWSAVSALGRL